MIVQNIFYFFFYYVLLLIMFHPLLYVNIFCGFGYNWLH